MALQETKSISKIIFWPMAAVSTIFTVILFWDFGDKVTTAILWSIVGLTMELLKLLFLAKWRNSVVTKNKRKLHEPILYISLAALSAVASLTFGIGTIERQGIAIEYSGANISELEMRIKDAEERILKYPKIDTRLEVETIDRQINALTGQITNVTVGVSERSIQLTSEIQRLQDKKNALGRAPDKVKDELITSLAKMKSEYAYLSKGAVKAKKSFETLGGVLGVGTNAVMITFLLFVVVVIEIGMATTCGTATASVGIISKPKKDKKKANNQILFDGIKTDV